MINQYFGATQKQLGATYLNSRAILNVQEGYLLPGGIEYTDIGEFEISDFSQGGGYRQSLSIDAHAISKRPIYMDSYFTKQFNSSYFYRDDFTSQTTFDQNWNAGPANNTASYGITNLGSAEDPEYVLQGVSITGMDFQLNSHEFENFRATMRARFTVGASASTFGILFHSNVGLSYLYIYNFSANRVRLFRRGSFGATTLQSTNITVNNNTYYKFILSQSNGKIRGFYTSDDVTFSLGVSWNLGNFEPELNNPLSDYPETARGGLVGMIMQGTGSASGDVDYFEVTELETQYTKDDVINSAYDMASSYGSTIAAEWSGISFFNIGISGASWVYGTSNNVFNQQGAATGSSWNTLITGVSFNNFVAEVDIRASVTNGVYGLIVGNGTTVSGTSSNWYTNWHVSDNNTNNPTNSNNVEHFYNGTRVVYRGNAPYWSLASSQWYRHRLVKQNSVISWFVNEQLVNSIVGLSLTDPDNVFLGLASWKGNPTGSTVEFRGFRVSELDDLVENITQEVDTPVQSIIDRILPDGYAIANRLNRFDIFQLGDSRGSHDIGLSDYIIRSDQTLSNIVGDKYTITKFGDPIGVVENQNSRVRRQVDSNRMALVRDEVEQTLSTAKKISLTDMAYTNKNIQPISIEVVNRPIMEQYDRVSLVEPYIGVSDSLLVFNISKEYNASSGSFRITLQLNDYDF